MISWDKTPELLPMRCCRAWVEINLAALAHNVRSLKALLPIHSDLMTVVKADAYGHGAVTVAQTALKSGASWLGVATVPEGIELRQAGIAAPILVMGAVNDPEEVRAIAAWQLQPTIVNFKQALVFSETLAAYYGDENRTDPSDSPVYPALPVHLKLDTGMSRLGFDWQQAVELARFVKRLAHLETVSVYSHLATADSPDPTVMRQQHQRFEGAITALKREGLLPPRLHLANSAATLSDPALHYDMVRVGLATYGLYPSPHLKNTVELRPVLEVKARITHLKTVEPGTGISYGHKFVARQQIKVATVGIGYADGIPRILSNQMQALVGGVRVRQIGNITMDQLMLDVSAIPAVQAGNVVTLLGQSGEHMLSADQWAKMAGTISWEILCGFKHRLPRIEAMSAEPIRSEAAQIERS
jgi:alanine racemase